MASSSSPRHSRQAEGPPTRTAAGTRASARSPLDRPPSRASSPPPGSPRRGTPAGVARWSPTSSSASVREMSAPPERYDPTDPRRVEYCDAGGPSADRVSPPRARCAAPARAVVGPRPASASLCLPHAPHCRNRCGHPSRRATLHPPRGTGLPGDAGRRREQPQPVKIGANQGISTTHVSRDRAVRHPGRSMSFRSDPSVSGGLG